jgi:hypothetical protein
MSAMASSPRDGLPVVFLGPTLHVSEASHVLEAVYLPPAAQGSIVSAVQRFAPSAILLIDGSFQDEPAVRHKELLWAMSVGVPVIGAGSMGALRAAELWPYGVHGVGAIYRWYRRYHFAPDDAVAVLHGPPELGCRPLTQALVDLRLTFRKAERRGRIDAALRRRLDAAAGRLNFRDRTLDQVVEAALGCAADAGPSQQLAVELQASFASQKKIDALKALAWLNSCSHRSLLPDPALRPFRFTAAFQRDLQDAGIQIAPLPAAPAR